MILMPSLTGKAAAFRFTFCSSTFTPLSHAAIGMSYCVPIIAIFYMMSTQHQIHVNYYMFLYYFCGNFMFGMIVFIPVCMFIDRPIYAYLNLKRDLRDARHSQYYKIGDYIQNFIQDENENDQIVDPYENNGLLDSDIKTRLYED
jgi:hypothetical protein